MIVIIKVAAAFTRDVVERARAESRKSRAPVRAAMLRIGSLEVVNNAGWERATYSHSSRGAVHVYYE